MQGSADHPGMQVQRVPEALRDRLDSVRSAGRSVGFVPTMGALHEGHLSLIASARGECDVVVVSIFVNPLQFAPSDDLAAYPRPFERDRDICSEAGVDLLFAPGVQEMYSVPIATTVSVDELSLTLEGASRPGHFAGVATVVAKLLNLVGPCRAYFGEKDFQQLAVVRRMVADLSFPVTIVGCPTVREPDGLAMSSRNTYLTPAERNAAPVLYRALLAGATTIEAGLRDGRAVAALMAEVVAAEPLAALDYAEVVDPLTLTPLDVLAGEVRLVVAARLGRPRLLDNLAVHVPPTGGAP